MSEIKRIAEAVRDAINGTVIMQVDEALARIVTNQMEGIVGVELRVATDGVVDGNFIGDVSLNNDGSDILRELSRRAGARAAIWTDVAVKLDDGVGYLDLRHSLLRFGVTLWRAYNGRCRARKDGMRWYTENCPASEGCARGGDGGHWRHLTGF